MRDDGDFFKWAKRDMPDFEDQNRPKKVKEIYRAIKRDKPDTPAKNKARWAHAAYNKMKSKKGASYIRSKLSAKIPYSPDKMYKVMASQIDDIVAKANLIEQIKANRALPAAARERFIRGINESIGPAPSFAETAHMSNMLKGAAGPDFASMPARQVAPAARQQAFKGLLSGAQQGMMGMMGAVPPAFGQAVRQTGGKQLRFMSQGLTRDVLKSKAPSAVPAFEQGRRLPKLERPKIDKGVKKRPDQIASKSKVQTGPKKEAAGAGFAGAYGEALRREGKGKKTTPPVRKAPKKTRRTDPDAGITLRKGRAGDSFKVRGRLTPGGPDFSGPSVTVGGSKIPKAESARKPAKLKSKLTPGMPELSGASPIKLGGVTDIATRAARSKAFQASRGSILDRLRLMFRRGRREVVDTLAAAPPVVSDIMLGAAPDAAAGMARQVAARTLPARSVPAVTRQARNLADDAVAALESRIPTSRALQEAATRSPGGRMVHDIRRMRRRPLETSGIMEFPPVSPVKTGHDMSKQAALPRWALPAAGGALAGGVLGGLGGLYAGHEAARDMYAAPTEAILASPKMFEGLTEEQLRRHLQNVAQGAMSEGLLAQEPTFLEGLPVDQLPHELAEAMNVFGPLSFHQRYAPVVGPMASKQASPMTMDELYGLVADGRRLREKKRMDAHGEHKQQPDADQDHKQASARSDGDFSKFAIKEDYAGRTMVERAQRGIDAAAASASPGGASAFVPGRDMAGRGAVARIEQRLNRAAHEAAKAQARKSLMYKFFHPVAHGGEHAALAAGIAKLDPVTALKGYPIAELLHYADPTHPLALGIKEGLDPSRKLVRSVPSRVAALPEKLLGLARKSRRIL